MKISRRNFVMSAAATAAATATGTAWAQDANTVRLVVPSPGGGPLDVGARPLAEGYRQVSSRTCIIDNRPGASGTLAIMETVRSRPDGSTLLYFTGSVTTYPALLKNAPYAVERDLVPVARISRSPGFALLVGGKTPYKSLAQLINHAKANPGKVTCGTAGVGSTTHVAAALFAKAAGIEFLYVPYKGSVLVDLISGIIDCTFVPPNVTLDNIRSGAMRGLAISDTKRYAKLPDMPTYAELGLPVADVPGWSGLWGPKGMSAGVANRLYEEFAAAAKRPVYDALMQFDGSELALLGPAAFRDYVNAEIRRYNTILPPLGIEITI
ncbi:MAG: tripartite tricarboxylate transporter substrate binding protein [Rubrivivax sp.]